MPWQRPASVPIGRVWGRFQGRERDGKPANMYQIRDVEDAYKQQCLELMQETFLRDEPLCIALGITEDPDSIATIRANWEELLAQGASVACFAERGGAPHELVGVNVTFVRTRDDPDEDLDNVRGESWRRLLRTLAEAEARADVFRCLGVEAYLSSSGLTVAREHRGQNLGARFFEARKPLCKALGLQATATVFTALTSQALARKCGYAELAELRYADMTSQGIDLSASPTPSAIVMGTKFNFED